MKTVIYLLAFAAPHLMVPNAAQVVMGAATTTAKVGDTVRVGIYADQLDAGMSELFLAIPYTTTSLEYVGLDGDGLTANKVIVGTTGSVNIKWTGTMAPGASGHLGYVVFKVIKADKSEFQGQGLNPSAKDLAGTLTTDVQVMASEAIVQLSPRPIKVNLDLRVN